jgi:general secretion pathway protein H
VISLAGSDNRGFSLFELILVLLLIGISTAIVLPNIERSMANREVKRAALGLAAAARDLRSRALLDGVPKQIVLNLPENSYRAWPSVEVRLPADVQFASVDGGEFLDRDHKRFYFFPNGSSMAGTIVLADSVKSISYLIRLESLTGRVAVTPGDNS